MRKVVVLLLVVALGVAGAYVAAGMQAPPSVTITGPGPFAGAAIPLALNVTTPDGVDRKSTRLNSSHVSESRMPSSA